jgi:hypothetical protein
MVADKSVRIADSKIGQNLYVANVRAEGSLRIQSTDVAGELSMTNSRVNGQLQLTSVTVAKQITFDYMTVLRAELSKSTFTGTVFFDHTKVDRHLQILDTTLSEGILARLLRADDVEITKTKTGSELFFKSLMASSLRISDLKALSADCKACTLNISNAHVGNVAILDFKGNEITAGNGRFNTFDLSKGVISNFDCSDCAIEQYIAIKGKILRFADLRGLKVNGALLLSEEGRRSCWGKGAFINMAQFKADTLGIDAEDIVAEERENSTDSCERTAKGPFVSVRMTGATYRAITGGRNAYDGPPSTDAGKPGVGTSATISAKSHPITDLAAPQLIQFIRGYKAENAQDYDPQPYEEMANALTRAGVTDKATALKIARIDDRVASPETGVLERLWYRIYRLASRYGFENERVAVVFLLLLFAGTAIHHAQVDCLPGVQIVEGKKTSLLGRILYSFWFSLDRAIPPLHLEMHSEADAGLPWLVLHYFYMHRVLGTFLLSVFAAGAAGVGH